MYPKVHHARIVLGFAHLIADPATTLRMLDPEVTDILAGVRQGQISAFRVRERGTVEV